MSLVYYLDGLVLVSLTCVVIIAWRTSRRRAFAGKRKRAGPSKIVFLLILAFLLLHVWAQIRPVPVLVETTRPMTDAERAPFVGRGIPIDMLADMKVAEHKPFDGLNAGVWSPADVRKLKQLLAWHSICPRLPKEIIIQEKGFVSDSPSAEAYYNWVGSARKAIYFNKSEDGWEMGPARYLTGCGAGPTNFLENVVSRVPVSLRIY